MIQRYFLVTAAYMGYNDYKPSFETFLYKTDDGSFPSKAKLKREAYERSVLATFIGITSITEVSGKDVKDFFS